MTRKIKISSTGLELSPVALGFWRLLDWNVNEKELQHIVESSIGIGITTFDHADIYGSFKCEELFGAILKANPQLRNQMQIVTKCDIIFKSPQRPEYNFHYYDTSKEHIIKSVDRSLKNFGTDYLDLLLIHRPDPLMNAEDTAEGLNEVIKSGKIKFAGVSNFYPHQLDLLQSKLDFPLVTNQIEFSAIHTEPLLNGMLDQCQRLKFSPMIYSPLAGGRILSDPSEKAARIRNALNSLSGKYNASPDQIALAWIFKHPSDPSVIIGTGKIDRIQEAAASVNIKLSREDWFRIYTASLGNEVP